MELTSGTKLGPYEIEEALGAGGMGEVYRAVDSRLDRRVAIKILPEHLALNPELRQRFEREAKAVSSLSHPHICSVFDVGREEGVDYLVMEYLEGESLADRLEGGALETDELLRYAIQMADALDKAHRQGVVHRDLKPGNVMLTKDGVKLVDFGLAKVERPGGEGTPDLTASPTLSRPLTAEGTIMGTYQYMSPEQLEGREADPRSDLFAFGAVVYEMATGERAFSGASQASLIGSIMHSQPPPASAARPMVPPALDRVIAACLAKDPEERWQTAHDVLLQLRWIAEGGSVVGLPAPVAARRKSRERTAWALASVALVAALLFAVGYVLRAPEPERPVRFEIAAGPEFTFVGSPRISPDGRHLAFHATDTEGKTQLWLRSLDSLEPRPLSGTGGAGRPFWSPDSRYLAFFAGGKLEKVEIGGGPAQVVCDAPTGADGSWGVGGTILFDGQGGDPIAGVPASGGIPRPVVDAEGAESVGWPEFLPDGERFLYVRIAAGDQADGLLVGSLDPEFEPVEILPVTSRVQYAPPGYLVYVRDGSLVAQPFDLDSLEIVGEPMPVAEDVGASGIGLAHFSASTTGVLTYRAGEGGDRRLVWIDREGRELGEIGEPGRYDSFAVSPAGDRVAFSVEGEGGADLWIHDLERGVSSRFTFDPGDDGGPLWSPDGRWIVFSSARDDGVALYRKAATGVGEPEAIYSAAGRGSPHSWTADGRYLAFNWTEGETSWDVMVLPFDEEGGPGEAFALVQSGFVEVRPAFSPDGRWVSYDSNESGRMEVYVRQFPGPGGKWQVSTNGGSESWWGPGGRELYYLSPEGILMRVDTELGDTFRAGLPEVLAEPSVLPAQSRNRFVATADGERFLVLSPAGRDSIFPTTVVLGWPETLSR